MMEAHCEVYCGEYLSSHTDVSSPLKQWQIEGEFLDEHTLTPSRFLISNWFLEYEHPFINKAMVTTEPLNQAHSY